ncbi:hypothetical protein BDY24DRAFT_381465 [Mrakia frigida]|uniref:uncharacterized protein n=1 Tax=Mrakia frigida TaxID=29902 RepID=UPI003FCC118F
MPTPPPTLLRTSFHLTDNPLPSLNLPHTTPTQLVSPTILLLNPISTSRTCKTTETWRRLDWFTRRSMRAGRSSTRRAGEVPGSRTSSLFLNPLVFLNSARETIWRRKRSTRGISCRRRRHFTTTRAEESRRDDSRIDSSSSLLLVGFSPTFLSYSNFSPFFRPTPVRHVFLLSLLLPYVPLEHASFFAFPLPLC